MTLQVHNDWFINKLSTPSVNGLGDNLWAICGALASDSDPYRMVNRSCILMPLRSFERSPFY